MREIKLDGTRVADDTPAYVIAEIGNNHGGSIDIAKRLIDAAHGAGANAVKFQARTMEALYTRAYLDRPYAGPQSYGATYGEHRKALELSWDGWWQVVEHAQDVGITWFSTPMDVPAVNRMQAMGCPIYKVASGDLRSVQLIEHIGQQGKPVILSTAGGVLSEIKAALASIPGPAALLHCVAEYPACPASLRLGRIYHLRGCFDETVGYSSHDTGITAPVVAYALGARIIEKHFTLDRTMKGTDHAMSVEPKGLALMIENLGIAHEALSGNASIDYSLPSEEAALTKMRKSCVAARDLPAGHTITLADIAFKCPGEGALPAATAEFVGTETMTPIRKDDYL